jgi:amino acid permease
MKKKDEEFELNELFAYEKKASRIELFVRIFYAIPVYIILFFYSIVASLCVIIQWIIILILGKRSEGLSDFIKGYLEYYVHIISYFSFMTDKRPGVTPQKNSIYEVIEEEKNK